jgi:ATP-dependent DNA ligase
MDPDQFVPPMLAVTAPAPFSGEGWWFEPKWDGIRAGVRLTDGGLAVRSRRGHDLLRRYPVLGQLDRELVPPVVLDGELVAWSDGRIDFEALLAGRGQLVVVAFDCLYDASGWLLAEPLDVRRERLLRSTRPAKRVLLSPGVAGRGEDLYRATEPLGFEGVMAKRRTSRYWPGRRTDVWRKFLHLNEATLEVRAVTRQSGRWMADVGEVSQWPIVATVAVPSLPPGAPVPQEGERMAVPPGIVARVRYRTRTHGGRLRHAVFRGYGPDPW